MTNEPTFTHTYLETGEYETIPVNNRSHMECISAFFRDKSTAGVELTQDDELNYTVLVSGNPYARFTFPERVPVEFARKL